MALLTNGFPKSGCHALVKAVQLLGQPCEVQHLPYQPLPGVSHHLYIKRDPRNLVISWLRWRQQSVTPGMFLAALRQFGDRSLVKELAGYEGWLKADAVHVVAYEDLIEDDRAIRRISRYLDVPYLRRAWESLPGLTPTWHPVHSDYRTIWTDQLDEQWRQEGGPELLKRWGY